MLSHSIVVTRSSGKSVGIHKFINYICPYMIAFVHNYPPHTVLSGIPSVKKKLMKNRVTNLQYMAFIIDA
jgi:hypothetical protein